jgi:FkbM family methyltransferase
MTPATSRKFFSQQGEDFLLWSLFDDRNTAGYFVDVGAFDGIHLSNTYSFELAGWGGVCVEAHPHFFPYLLSNRPASVCVHAACVNSSDHSETTFLSEPLGLLSGIRADTTPGIEIRYANRGMTFPGFTPLTVPAMTLTDILRQAGAPRFVDFFSLDVEGTELEVLEGLDFDTYNFRAIVIECNTTDQLNSIHTFFEQRAYLHARSLGVNHVFVRTQADAHTLSNASISCIIEDTLHPFGEGATHPASRGRKLLQS